MRRRLRKEVLAGLAAMIVAGVVLVGALACVAARPDRLARNLVAWRAVTNVVSRPFARLVLPPAAMAGEELKFKPVPRESTARFEKMKIVRRTPAPDPTDTMSFDQTISPPDLPDVPEPPDPVDRSGSVMKIGSDIFVGPNEVVHGDLSSVNGDITIEGHVEGDVVAMRGDVELKSTAKVDGDVVCLGGSLSEDPGAQVGGQRVTTGRGARSFHIDDSGDRPRRYHRDGDRLAGALVWLLLMLLFGWLCVRFAPGRTVAATQVLRESPLMSLGIGSLVVALAVPSIIALVVVMLLLIVTIIGIPLAVAAPVGYFFLLALLAVWGFVTSATVLGGALSKLSHQPAPGTYPAGVAPGAPLDPAQAAAMGVATTPYSGLMRPMVTGVLVLMGSVVFGRLLQLADFGPLHGFGTLFLVLGIVGSAIATTFGAGALLRSEIAMGTFQRLWSGRRFANGAARAQAAAQQAAAAQAAAAQAAATGFDPHGFAPAGPVPVPPPAPSPPPTPPPPSPPSDFMPPPAPPAPPIP